MLPIIDITPLASESLEDRLAVARELDTACAQIGFVYVCGEQLDPALFARLLARAERYFALSDEEKMRSYIGASCNHSGYVPVGEEQFGGGTCDLKEAYDINYEYSDSIGRRALLGPNTWPDDPGFRADVAMYYQHVTAIGRSLFRAFALALGLNEQHFEAHTRQPPSQLRLIHYPLDPSAQDRPGIGAHTDYECFTLLFATAPGLQILGKDGAWLDVPVKPGTLVMNIGDMMEIMFNGRYMATKHRVRKVAQERFSFPLFVSCDYDYVVRPLVPGQEPRYAPVRCGEHLFNQTAQTFAYLKRRIAAGELVLDNALPLDSFGLHGTEAL